MRSHHWSQGQRDTRRGGSVSNMPSWGILSGIKKFVCGYSYCLGVDGCVFLMGAECGGVLGVFFVCGGGVGFGGVVVLRNILRWVGVIGVPPCGGVVRCGGLFNVLVLGILVTPA